MDFNIAIIDYEMGNLKSVYKCLNYLNVQTIITDSKDKILNADGIILPGVGAFGIAIETLIQKKLDVVIKQAVAQKIPLFGICLGLQLLFSKSEEMGEYEGLNLIIGNVNLFEKNLVDKIPHIGWNNVSFTNNNHFLLEGIPNNSYFYFVHSYFAVPKDKQTVLGTTQYGNTEFASIIGDKNIIATQFHPEKSGKTGISLLKNFIKYCKK
jgi:glutamine amidotransferase